MPHAARHLCLAAPIILIVPLNACSDGGHYRVLLPRASEIGHASPSKTPAQTVPPRPADVALLAQLSSLEAQAQAGQAAFVQQRAKMAAKVLAARSAPMLSEAWVDAQQALSALEAARGPTLIARGALDSLAIHAIDTGSPGAQEIESTQKRVAALADEQDRVLQNVAGNLSQSETGSR